MFGRNALQSGRDRQLADRTSILCTSRIAPDDPDLGSRAVADILPALAAGATQIDGFELNGRIVELLRDGLDGYVTVAHRTELHLIHDEARHAVQHRREQYDVIRANLVATRQVMYVAASSEAPVTEICDNLPNPDITVPRLKDRLSVAVSIGMVVAAIVYVAHRPPDAIASDWDHIWVAARALLNGQNPYLVLDPLYRAGQFEYPLIYPGTALVVALPFALVPQPVALALWMGLGTAGLAWVLTRHAWWGLLGLLSAAYLHSLIVVQWSPMLTGAVAAPWLGFLWAAKPTIGLPLVVGWPSRPAILGGLGLVVLSLLLLPGWPADMAARTHAAPHVIPMVLRPGGFLLLLAFLRWRVPEARLLGALALIPQTTVPAEMVPLLLIPRTWRQMAAFVSLSLVAYLLAVRLEPGQSHTDLPGTIERHWPFWLAFVYLPCLWMVLRRPSATALVPLVLPSTPPLPSRADAAV